MIAPEPEKIYVDVEKIVYQKIPINFEEIAKKVIGLSMARIVQDN